MALLQKCLWDSTAEVDEDQKSLKESFEQKDGEVDEKLKGDTNKTPLLENGENGDTQAVDVINDSCDSDYESVYHPNHNTKTTKRTYKGCKKYLNRFDEMIMKPIFIYRYERTMM